VKSWSSVAAEVSSPGPLREEVGRFGIRYTVDNVSRLMSSDWALK